MFRCGAPTMRCEAPTVAAMSTIVSAGASLTASDAQRLGHAATIGVISAVALLQFERWSGGALLRLLHRTPIDPAMLIYRYDRGVTFLLLAAWPVAAVLAARRSYSPT